MKYFLLILLCALPASSLATKLANCDSKPYEVTIINGGQSRTVTLHPHDASIEEFGPQVSMQLPGQKPVVIHEQYDDYCIWSGKIKLQRINSGDQEGGNGHI